MAAGGGRLARRSGALAGEISPPGDKSISHRALIFGALAEGETTITGLLEGHDVIRTAAAIRALGAAVERDLTDGKPLWRVSGREFQNPERPLYFGNSGTGCRLVLGAAAGRRVAAVFDGDQSLRSRPMARVADPLRRMGAQIELENGRLPARLSPAPLTAIDYRSPVASAQVKSAILLAALGASGETRIIEPSPSRDHTERMLAAFGVKLHSFDDAGGRGVAIRGGQKLRATPVDVPGDPSSAAFLAAAAAITPGSDILIHNVLVNPLRTGFFETLKEMGGAVTFANARTLSGEAVADIAVRHTPLKGVDVPAARAASMIDEYPILAIVAAFSQGETRMNGIEELRVKESDRLAAIESGLIANGVSTESGADFLVVAGKGRVAGGGRVETRLDHRIAMSFLIMGLGAESAVAIDDAAMIATSYPSFEDDMRRLGADIAAT